MPALEDIDAKAQSALTLCDGILTEASQDPAGDLANIDTLLVDMSALIPSNPQNGWLAISQDIVSAQGFLADAMEAQEQADTESRNIKITLIKIRLQAIRATISQMINTE